MKMHPFFSLFFGIVLMTALASCSNVADQGPEKETEPAPPSLEDYVGRYNIVESKYGKYFDVFLKNDTLFLNSLDRGSSVMYAEKNEVFDIPGHETKMRFLRDDAGEVDRAAFLTKKGKYTATRVPADSVGVAPGQ